MIFYRLTDEQAGRATTAIVMGVPIVAFLALQLANEGRRSMAIGFVSIMLLLFGLIAVQISQSRRLNGHERDAANG